MTNEDWVDCVQQVHDREVTSALITGVTVGAGVASVLLLAIGFIIGVL